jgi:hypothetical protein
MKRTLDIRERLYDQFHGSNAGDLYFFKPENADVYAAYYTAMYLIQDTGEAVFSHLAEDFSDDPMTAYLQFWGVMQAIFIQQDAISELYAAVVNAKLDIKPLKSWRDLRDLRNLCAGHPSKRSQGVPVHQRSFMGRAFGKYSCIRYEVWDAATGKITHPTFDLRMLIDRYDEEASDVLRRVLCEMRRKWP